MKKVTIISGLIFVIVLMSNILNAQVQRKEINGDTYSYNVEDKTIINIKNSVSFNSLEKRCEQYSVNETESIDDILKSIFSEERIAYLAENEKVLSLLMFCTLEGKVISVEFSLINSELMQEKESKMAITLGDINKLEKRLLRYKFEINSFCPDIEYYPVMKAVRFDRLL